MPATSLLTLLLLLVAALLLAASPSPVAAGDGFGGGGRMVIVRTARTGGAGGAPDKWLRRRRLEDEVAPEFPGLLGGGIGYDPLNKDQAQCGIKNSKNCAAPGHPYTQDPPRPCLYSHGCPNQGPGLN